MRAYHSNEIGNVVVLGHSGSGKTSVIEAKCRCVRSLWEWQNQCD